VTARHAASARPAGSSCPGLARYRQERAHGVAPADQRGAHRYPALLPERGGDCGGSDPTRLGPIGPADIDWLRDDVLKALNRTIDRVTTHHGDHYVDLYTTGIGHDACRPEGTKWIEGICGDAEDFWPTAFPGALPFDCADFGKRATLVHPNAKAHVEAARHVERAVRQALFEHRQPRPPNRGLGSGVRRAV
jgi:hypothetical protein